MDMHEIAVTTVMVLVFAAGASIFFLLADEVIRQVVIFSLGIVS